MAQLQHWIVTCTTCDSPAEYHCNTCGDILCPRCKDIHERSRGTVHHSIVHYKERVKPGKLIGQCINHPGNQWILWDQTCSKAVCPECVASPHHESHKFAKLAAILDEQRKAIQEEFGTYTKLLQTWEESLQKIQSNMKNYENEVDELEKEICQAGDRVCYQVRSIEAELHKQLLEIKSKQRVLFLDHEQHLIYGMKRIKQKIKEAEEALRSEDMGVLLRHRVVRDKEEINQPPERNPPHPPVFTPGTLVFQSLKTMIGSLSTQKIPVVAGAGISSDGSANLISKEYGDTRSHTDVSWSTLSSSASTISLLPAGERISTIQTSKSYAPYVACTGSGKAWLKTGLYTLQLMDSHGSSEKTIYTGFSMAGITITQEGDLLISDCNKFIKILPNKGGIHNLLSVKWKPFGIVCLRNGNLLVMFYEAGRAAQYSRAGKMVRELDKSLFRHPLNVAQNKVNKQIYICDRASLGLDSTGKVLAFDDITGRLVYEYTGPDSTTFSPFDVCTDQAGHVIVTDYTNYRIHILDKDGRFLQYMLTRDQGLCKPFCIDTDKDGYAWVGEWDLKKTSQVKILRYLH